MALTKHEKLTRRAVSGRRKEDLHKTIRRPKRTPPISPEPSGILTPHVPVENSARNGRPLLDIGKLHELTKRVLVTGVTPVDLLAKRKTSVGTPPRHGVRKVALKVFWKHFNALFPGYIQPSRAILNYVPVFREFFDRTTCKAGQRHGSRWTTENKAFYASLRKDPPIPFFEIYTRGMLIHPALGLFPEKTVAVFDWTIPEPLTKMKFNGRRFTKDELN